LVGPETASEAADTPFFQSLERSDWIVDLVRARAGVGRDGEVPVPHWLNEIPDTWLAIPLLHGGRMTALIILCRPLAQRDLTWEDFDLLRTAARQAASYFALEIAADALARERQFAAFSRFSAFLMHDLSNIVAQQQLIVNNAGRHKTNPAFVDDAIDTISNNVVRMGRLLDEMKAGRQVAPPRMTRLADACRAAVDRLAGRRPRPTLEIQDAQAGAVVPGEGLERVVEHAIRNAVDATPPDGSVAVRVRREPGWSIIEVSDTGCGMAPEFIRDRLFRPFDSTKGTKGMGIGAYQVREFARAAGGDVQVSSVVGRGTAFVIRLPEAGR
jgi:putative PEP-CTERM system histidine kinase